MPVRKLLEFLDRERVPYSVINHHPTYTSHDTAVSAHIPEKELAKTVIIKIDGKMAMAVLPGSYKVVLDMLKKATHSNRVELATEKEFRDMFPECEIGAMPPFGNLYGMEVFMAQSLADDNEIAFNAGTHTELIKLSLRDYENLVHPKMIKFSAH
jgi:Ala-tRNA(Pro) deacylase